MPLGEGVQGHQDARVSVQATDAWRTIFGTPDMSGSPVEAMAWGQSSVGEEQLALDPEPLGFRPHPELSSDKAIGPLGFRPEGCPPPFQPEASICSLPLAALVCKAIRERGASDPGPEADLVVEDLPLYAEPGGVQSVEEYLDRVTVELHRLCEHQRQIVLEEAAQGLDCSLEAQELNRLVELQEELVQELAESRLEVSVPSASSDERLLGLRLSTLQGDIGGGCEAVFEGQKDSDPPLQTKIVSVEEVLRDIESWWSPMLAEYQALVHEKQVVRPVTAKQLAAREAAGEVFQVIPAKLIFTLKAFTARRKVRCVGCGNYLGGGEYTANQLYAGGLDVVSLRCCLVIMIDKQWSAGVVDIKTAFLNAELQPEDFGARRVVIRTPGLWRRLGICAETFWDVHRALYGLQISPAAWPRCRDRTLPKLRLATCSGTVRLLQFKSDGNIWAIVPADAEEPVDPSLRLGLLLVYVDDMMVLGTPQIITDVIAELAKQWELSSPEFLDEGNIHYRGVEVQRCDAGILIHQASYTQELLSRHPDKGGADVPALKVLEPVQAKVQDPQVVRRAQQIAGELLWLSGLTRPEIQFSVGAISRMISINAEEALLMGDQVLKYLRRYPNRGLWYGQATMTWEDEGDLSVPMGRASLVGFCDASFAPTANRSLQATMAFYNGALIAWSSTRQSHTTLSTAEAELVAITTLFGELQALEPLVCEIQGSQMALQMFSDSQAAIAICTTTTSNWRTRHLRLRASFIKEMLESGKYGLHHIKGESMKADIGTKPLAAPRFQQLVSSLGMTEPTRTTVKGLRILDGALEEKVRVLLTCLVVASLLGHAEAHASDRSSSKALGEQDWQFLVGLVVVTVCCWEVFKAVGHSFGKGCKILFRWCSRLRLEHECVDPGIQVVQHVDDIAVFGPREAVLRHLDQRDETMEVMTAPEGPGAPLSEPLRRRRRGHPTAFEFNSVEILGWPSCLTLDLNPVGQDRYEYRCACRTLLRWHVSARVRLFAPDQTRLPVPLSKLTGRRRTYVIDVSPDSPADRQRRVHVDNWRVVEGPKAYLGFSWIGCTALEVDF